MKKDELKAIYYQVAEIVRVHQDFNMLNDYLLSMVELDNNMLMTALIATKAFRDRPEIKETVERIRTILETRLGKKLY